MLYIVKKNIDILTYVLNTQGQNPRPTTDRKGYKHAYEVSKAGINVFACP